VRCRRCSGQPRRLGRTASRVSRLSARAQSAMAARVDAHPAPCELVVVAAVTRIAPVSFEGERENDLEEPGRREGPLTALRASKPLVLLLRRELMEANRPLAEPPHASSDHLLLLPH